MIDLLIELTKEFKQVHENSYHHKKTDNKQVFPYLTFDLSDEYLERNVTGVYLDVDLMDSNSSYLNLFTLESDLKAHFKDRRLFTDDLYLRFEYLRSNTVNTNDEQLKRRNLQFYCKVDWRNK